VIHQAEVFDTFLCLQRQSLRRHQGRDCHH
jgi:hypothetical protein